MTLLRIAGCILATAVCTACIPVVNSYHGASTAGGETEGGGCTLGSAGPPSKLEIDRGAIHIIMDGSDLSGGLLQHLPPFDSGYLELEFQVPVTVHAGFDRKQLMLHDHQTGSPVPFGVGYQVSYLNNLVMHVPDDGNLDPQALAKVHDEEGKGGYVRYQLYIHIPNVPADLDFHVPALTIDGIAYPSIEASFDHAVGFYCAKPPPAIP